MIKYIFPILIILNLVLCIKAYSGVPINSYLTDEQAKWAFGDNYKAFENKDFVISWNKRWGKLFEMHDSDVVSTDMQEVKRLAEAAI